MRIAFIGGIYSNYHALVATLDDIARRIGDDFGFAPDLTHFAIFGLCRECRVAEAANADAS